MGLRMPDPRLPMASLNVYETISRNKTPCSIATPLNEWPVRYPGSVRHAIRFDSTGHSVTITESLLNRQMVVPRRYAFKNYLYERYLLENRLHWRNTTYTNITSGSRLDQGGRGLVIETPRIRSEAFRKVFGGETMSLRVTGTITIDGSMRNEKRSQVRTASNRPAATNFQMKQTQRFRVEGKIGENVSIFVDQDSERPFEFENAIKLQYSSDEDGIIQSIEAGNVSLSLPGTRFVTVSAANAGLFGIKSHFKLGPLDLTAVASMEKGEKNRLSITGGEEEELFEIHDYNYKKGTYFFLDSFYQNQYATGYDRDSGVRVYNPQYNVEEIEVYKSDAMYESKPDARQMWAVLDPNNADTLNLSESYKGYFIRLEPDEYYLQQELGFIALNMPLRESEILAVGYRNSMGTTTGALDTLGNLIKMIKPRNARPTDKTWDLEWKNVYSLGGRDIEREGFELRMYYKPASGDPVDAWTINGQPKGFLNIFGLDNVDQNGNPNPDNIADIDPTIINLARGEIVFPNLRPFDPIGDAAFPFPPELASLRTSAIYDTTNDTYIRQQSKFYFEVKSSRSNPVKQLGINVIENSEEVLLNGMKLQKDIDYVIDYFSGTLTLLKEEATAPNANLDITYERQQMFSMDKRSLMGARAEYTLWEKGPSRSFLGATLLYMNQKTLDRRIRIGQDGPMSNLVWDINGRIQFESNLITKALDAIPLLNVSSPSGVLIEGEVAQILPNPNPLNNEATGDHDGVAYLDDFEGSRRDISLSVIYTGWTPSSAPSTGENARTMLSKKGRLDYVNPFNQVSIQEIWPNREVTTNYGGVTRTHVLELRYTPLDTLESPESSWAGIQKALSSGYADQTDSRFLEIWIKKLADADYEDDRTCRFHIELGQISEDIIPDNQLSTEDKKRFGFRNDILDEDEDTGIDGVAGTDPPWSSDQLFYPHETARIENGVATPYDFWDLNHDNVKQPDEPWSYDDWMYESGEEIQETFLKINGTENNKNAGIAIYPDTEDLNRNGDVDIRNDYFEFIFTLGEHPDTSFIAGGKTNPAGWRLYRIPLDNPRNIVGSPDWSRIEYIRIWMDSVSVLKNGTGSGLLPYKVQIAEINLVGNEWKLRGLFTDEELDAAGTSGYFEDASSYNLSLDEALENKMTVSVVNTHDNPEYYEPPGVEGEIDPIQKIRSKEQSLSIRINNLEPGVSAITEKQFYEPKDLINYKRLKMFVNGGGIAADTSAFREFADDFTPEMEDSTFTSTVEFFLRWGSDTRNENYYEVRIPVRPGWDNNIEVDFEDLSRLKLMMAAEQDTISEWINGQKITIRGKPSLTNIRWLIVGVKNRHRTQLFTGEIWLDELRLSDVRKDKGMAMRFSTTVKLSDFLTFSGDYTRRDADFHTVNERFGKGDNARAGSISANIAVHRMLPPGWGLSIPVNVTFNKSVSTPKYKPGTDILINERTTTNEQLTELQSLNETKGLNVSFSKVTKSRNFFIRYLVDPLRTSFNYTRNDMSNSQTLYSKTVGIKGSVSYNLTLGNNIYFQPFKWVGSTGFLKKIADTRFYYLPSSIALSLNGNDRNIDSETRSGLVKRDTTATFDRDFSTKFQPFEMLSFDYKRSDQTDMRHTEWSALFEEFLLPGERININQNASVNLNPKIFNWFSTSLRYNTAYRWNDNLQMKSKGTGTSANVKAGITFTNSLDPGKLVQSFKGTSRSGRSVSTRSRRVSRQPVKNNTDTPPSEKNQKKGSPFMASLGFLGRMISKIDPVKVTYSDNKSANHYAILGTPSAKYQWGFSMDPEVNFSPNVTADRTSTSLDHRITIGTGVSITSQITASIDYTFSSDERHSTQHTGSVSRSALLSGNKAVPFPNWTFRWRGLEKLPLLSSLMRSVSLSHGFSGKETVTWNGTQNDTSRIATTRDFRPLVGVSMSFKSGITADFQYSMSEDLQINMAQGRSMTKQNSSDINLTAKYSKRGGIKLPFMKGKLDNRIDFSLTFRSTNNVTLMSKESSGQFQETAKTSNWSFEPRMTYTFTRTVTGGIYFELGARKDARIGETKITAFGINTTINLAPGT